MWSSDVTRRTDGRPHNDHLPNGWDVSAPTPETGTRRYLPAIGMAT